MVALMRLVLVVACAWAEVFISDEQDVASTEATVDKAVDDDNYLDGAESSVGNEQEVTSVEKQVLTRTESGDDEWDVTSTEAPIDNAVDDDNYLDGAESGVDNEKDRDNGQVMSGMADDEQDVVGTESPQVDSFKRVDVVEQDVATMGSNATRRTEIKIVYCEDGNACATKNALTWALIHLFAVHACGVDRCYMGSIGLGVAKGLTCGGCGIWALIDHVVFFYVALQKHPSIDLVGIKANFEEDSLQSAFIVAIICLVAIPLQACCGKQGHSRMSQRDN